MINRAAIIMKHWRRAKAEPFAWDAEADCIGWAAGVAQDIIGRDPIARICGRYSTEAGARRVMANEGWKNLSDVARAFFPHEIHPAEAVTGDWAVIVNEDGTETIGVVSNAMIAAKTKAGMGQVPRSRAVSAFRVE